MSDIERSSDAAGAGPESSAPRDHSPVDAPEWFVVREPVLAIIKAVLSVLILAWLVAIAVMACQIGWSARLVPHFRSVKVLRLVKSVIGDFGPKGSSKGRTLWRALMKHGHA